MADPRRLEHVGPAAADVVGGGTFVVVINFVHGFRVADGLLDGWRDA